jgi:type IV pilus assembly protein PilB
MEVEPFLLASSLRVIVAQRLVRRLCEHCREPARLDAATRQRFALADGAGMYGPRGCKECRDTGYKGRLGVFEVIRVSRELAQLIQCRASLDAMQQAVIQRGTKLLAASALDRVRAGLTSLQEAVSVSLAEEA